MRNLVVANMASLDGFYAGLGGDVMALPFDRGFSAYNLERLRSAGTLLLGRTTFDGFRRYWPSVADDESADPVEREISRRNNAIEKVVVSATAKPEDLAPWSDARILRPDAVEDRLLELKQQGEGDILVFGSRTTWNALLSKRLVDELHVMVGPALLARGVPLFQGEGRAPLRLLDHRRLADSQIVVLRYETAG